MKDRSPSFPFIPLGIAVERLRALNVYTGRDAVLASRVGKAWDMKEGSSQADQTLAALRSFGFVVYDGTGPNRQATITEDGRRLIRAQTDEVRDEIIKTAALRPKVIRKYWAAWGNARGADGACLDRLMDDKFSSAGARQFLKVYDETIAYAKLSTADKVISDENMGDDELEGENGGKPENQVKPPLNPPPPAPPGKAKLMVGERELTTGLLSKDANFRLIVSGPVGVKEIERLISKLELDKEILAEPDPEIYDEDKDQRD